MQQRRETWGSQSKLDVQEPMIFILQSTVEKCPSETKSHYQTQIAF